MVIIAPPANAVVLATGLGGTLSTQEKIIILLLSTLFIGLIVLFSEWFISRYILK